MSNNYILKQVDEHTFLEKLFNLQKVKHTNEIKIRMTVTYNTICRLNITFCCKFPLCFKEIVLVRVKCNYI